MNDHMQDENKNFCVDDKLKIHGGPFDGYWLYSFVWRDEDNFAWVKLLKENGRIKHEISGYISKHELTAYIIDLLIEASK